MTESRVIPGGTPRVLSYDAAPNDSDKTIPVPVGHAWMVTGIIAQLASSATVGNRNFRVYITDGTNVIWSGPPVPVLAASGVSVIQLTPGGSPAYITNAPCRISDGISAATSGGYGALPNPCVLPSGYTIRAYDYSAVDAAADDVTISVLGYDLLA